MANPTKAQMNAWNALRGSNRGKKKQQKKKTGNGKGYGSNGPSKSSVATAAFAQGVAAVTRTPFQMGRGKGNPNRPLQYLDATLPMHLSLPRSVGPYTVIRTTQIVSSSTRMNFFAFMASNVGGAATDEQWVAACGMSDVAAATAIGGSLNCQLRPMVGMDGLKESCVVSPAALTVQVMNPEALVSTTGITYQGRSTSQYELENSTRTWDTLGTEFVQFMSPRLCSAGKLALRGTKISSYPLDMSEISNFRGIRPFTDFGATGIFTWNSQSIRPAGFAPVVIYNPNSVDLQFLVTMEWRVRFDPSNPAAGSHTQHGVTTDALWDKVTSMSAAMGHGVEDIADTVARMGEGAAAVGGIAAAVG